MIAAIGMPKRVWRVLQVFGTYNYIRASDENYIHTDVAKL